MLFSAQTPLPQEGDVFTDMGDLPGGSSDVSPVQLAGMAPSSGSQSRHERTQHGRPAEGLEKSVLHNEWAKKSCAILDCIVVVVCPGASCTVGFSVASYFYCSMLFSWLKGGAYRVSVSVVKSDSGLWSSGCASGTISVTGGRKIFVTS